MNRSKRTAILLIIAVLSALMLTSAGFAAPSADFSLGNSDLNILNGGVMLTDGGDLYFSLEGGVFVKRGEKVSPLCAAQAENLNLFDGCIYFTENNGIYRLPASGGEAKLIYRADGKIKQMYVVSGDILFLSDGVVYELSAGKKRAQSLPAPENVLGLIPTEYGNIYLTGAPLDYELWAGKEKVLESVSSCYTDSGCLAVQIESQNYSTELSALLSGFNAERDLQAFNIHGTVQLMELLAPDDENAISEYNENNDLMLDFAALLHAAGMGTATLMSTPEQQSEASLETDEPGERKEPVIPEVSQGQQNIVKRARQLHEIEWTPLEDRYQWGYYGVFKAETTYSGIPYGQPVNTNGYVGYGVSLEGFEQAVLDNTSRFYTGYSTYNKIAPTFSTDCSGFVSYAWGIALRKTTYTLPQVAERVGDQSVYALQVGDCLNKQTSHVVLVSDVSYDSEGRVTGVEIMEQTPVITKLTRYGEGSSRSLASLQSYYLGGGYVIYRNPERDFVSYTPSAAVPLDDEQPQGMKNKAPKTKTSAFAGGKTVALRADDADAVIYYTLDGSAPTTGSTRYSSPITVYDTTKLRAIAYTDKYSDSSILEYTIKVPQCRQPTAEVSSGMSRESLVESGAKIKLSAEKGAKIYYTTDGSTPTSSSSVYSEPITISRDTTIKAVAEADGFRRSELMTASYTVGEIYTVEASADAGGTISPSGQKTVLEGGSVKYTISPKTGYEISDVLIDGVSAGALTEYEFTGVRANHRIQARFSVNTQIPFEDVPSDAWYHDAVSYAYSSALFSGTSETAFSPELTMTRGMFVTVLGRSAQLPKELSTGIGIVTAKGVNIRAGASTDTERVGYVENRNTPVQVLGIEGDWFKISTGEVTGYIRSDLMRAYDGSFKDLPEGRYYNVYAEWAYLTGITNGVSEDAFAPENSITREQMCAMLYKYATAFDIELPKGESITFSDDARISSYAREAVYALNGAGVINGMGDGSFSPQGTATRAQVAQVMMKFITAIS